MVTEEKRRCKGSAISRETVRFTDHRKRCAVHQKRGQGNVHWHRGNMFRLFMRSSVTFGAKYTGSTSVRVGKRRSRPVLS